ncbi:fructose-bisphosphate aldolase class I [Methylobacterium sp. BTF04]|uniref:class I fructose-bisphosphate aldolase n=1 Tax=Methylobacterium sp. BTF04 TaxID=2708300 RepID=UPI0013D0663F|nr:class I fructose-bisphosphate aldolase [Methylobacterium sp. BTF04]NEU14606.1 fructose-bisphosphate aldolase class I [Methylobacterium sp. BTF04]
MTTRGLVETARILVGAGKGLLAMDESSPTCDRRFSAAGIPQTVDMRRAYREMLVSAPGLGAYISGAILYDETIRQCDRHGISFVERLVEAGIVPGIKVDCGAKALALHDGETVTEGLDGLRDRLEAYAAMGARFAKWRAVIGLGDGRPSRACVLANAQALARYAALCQEAGIVPVVEPEVLMVGDHDLERCCEVTGEVLHAVFEALHVQGVVLAATILKPNMVLPGLACPKQVSVEVVAEATLRCFLETVPAAVAGIAFLSGGQSGALAATRLNAMNAGAGPRPAPWPLVFSFARAIQQPALGIWSGQERNVAAAQAALLHRARCSHAALSGAYLDSMDDDRRVLEAS